MMALAWNESGDLSIAKTDRHEIFAVKTGRSVWRWAVENLGAEWRDPFLAQGASPTREEAKTAAEAAYEGFAT